MAINLTQDEIDARDRLHEAIEQSNRDIAANGRVSAATQATLNRATRELTQNLDALGSSMLQVGKSLAAGGTTASDFNSAISASANAAATFLGTKGPLGLAVGKLVQVIGVYVGAVNKQADQLFDTYKDIADAGATGARGITEVFENMQKFGYTLDDLNKFSAIIKANSETLAVFGGTAAAGAKAFGDVSRSLQYGELGQQFQQMGISVDDINTGLAGYLKIQQLSGVTSKKTTDQLVQSSADYVKELDLLAKLTGQTRAGVQSQNEKALQQEQFAAYQYQLQQKIAGGGEAGAAAKAQLDNVTQVYQSMANQPGIQKGFLNALTGNLTDPDTIKFMQAMPRAYAESQQKIIDVNNFSVAAQKDTSDYLKGAGTELAKIGAADLIGPKFQEIAGYSAALAANLKDRVVQAKTEQQVTDDSTASIAASRLATRDITNSLQSMVNIGIKPVTAAMEKLLKSLSGISGLPAKVFDDLTPSSKRGNLSSAAPSAPGAPISATASSTLGKKIIQAESQGRNIPNQSGPGGTATSSAFGLAQITKGTFESLVKAAKPGNDLFGKTFEDMKKSESLQITALDQLSDSNRSILANANLSTTDAALYLAHFLGAAGAKRALQASDSAPLSAAISKDQIDANPTLEKMQTVGDLKAWADKKMGGGGYKFGGIATGPDSGYETTLHGTEAVVPLPNGNSIPVEMRGNDEQVGLMSAQLSRLDDIVRVMQTQLSVSQKILQYAQ
jgi:hypothetical protein